MSSSEGLVMAVFGPWGSGKTTLLNFVTHYLKEKMKGDELIEVPFNPWWFSGHEDLTRRFFEQVVAVLKKRRSVAKELTKRTAHFAEIVSESRIPYWWLGKVLARVMAPKDRDVLKIKAEVANLLKKERKRILVIIDDVDRLTVEELRQMFQVIKAVADFPNVLYLIALEGAQGIPGEQYLEKIVQVAFELPLPDKASLRRWLFQNLDLILAEKSDEQIDRTYWANVFFEGIDPFINTPRDVVRLSNTLSVTYPAVKGEVNPVDFLAVETLRVFCPIAYDVMRKNQESFAGHVNIGPYARDDRDSLKAFHANWIQQVPEKDREPIRRLLRRIFPKLESVWGNTNYGADWESSWRRALRVCTTEKFPIYFRLAMPEGAITHSELRTLLSLASVAHDFGHELVRLSNEKRPDGRTRVSAALELLQDYTREHIPKENIGAVLSALFDVGDLLLRPEDEPRGVYDFDNDIRIGRLMYQLLNRLEQPERFRVLKGCIQNGKSVATIESMVVSLGQQHGKHGAPKPSPEADRLLSSNQLEELERLALEKIREAARQDSLLNARKLPSILARWAEWGTQAEVNEWVQRVIATDDGLVNFLEKFLHKTYSQLLSDVVPRLRYRLDPEWLKPLVEPATIVDRVKKLAEKDALTQPRQTALNQFILEYQMREQGKDPNDPLAWRE